MIASHEFCGQMRSIRGTPAISEEQDLPLMLERVNHEVRDAENLIGVLLHKLLLDPCAVFKTLEDGFFIHDADSRRGTAVCQRTATLPTSLAPHGGGCYSSNGVSTESPAKALLIAFSRESSVVLYTINRLTPELLCFVLPEGLKAKIEYELQPHIAKMPRRWDWILTPDPDSFASCHQTLVNQLPALLKAWEIGAGDLVCDISDATAAMAASMALAARPMISRMVHVHQGAGSNGHEFKWAEGNLWNEEARQVRQDAARMFNRGHFSEASQLFRHIESMVSGSEKPLYHALGDLADGYGLWEQFQYRLAWEKLKTVKKTLDLTAAWGGPQGLSETLLGVKRNIEFLERIVLDPGDVKRETAYDLLAHAKRRGSRARDIDSAMIVLLRSLEMFAQYQLWSQFKIKTWDVQLDRLPQAIQEQARTCYMSDIDGKYQLPLVAQFRALAELGDAMGQTFLAEWAKLKTLFDAAGRSVLMHGFDSLKLDRFHQLVDLVMKVARTDETHLPKFPSLVL